MPKCPHLSECPAAGAGNHTWLYHAACALVDAGFTDEEATPIMIDGMKRLPQPPEIADALNAARNLERVETRKWSARDLDLIQTIKNEVEWSPERPNAATETTLRLLFPGNPLLCCGQSSSSFTTGILSDFRFLDRYQFIVPSPMTAKVGKTKKGHMSQHSLENTGPRHYQVVEFDWGTLDLQLKILAHLSKRSIPGGLVMVVHSGSKSAHGWFDFRGADEETQVKPFFDYAVRCGADPRLWLRSQFCRMPGGTRDDGRPQNILYLDAPYLRHRAKTFVSNSI
jgi:hypothetical protein